jgi:hypothetical protein
VNALVGRSRWVALPVLLLTTLCVTSAAFAAPSITGPHVSLDRTDVEIGSDLRVTVEDFESPKVILAICGNEGRRGSGDCNMVASMAESLAADGAPTVITMQAAAPPAPCPCIVRVSSRLDDEVAVATFTLIGHPVAPVVDSPTLVDPFAVTISARPAAKGAFAWSRASLGGPASYDVTATVRNRSTVPLRVIRVTGSAGRSAGNDLVTFGFDEPETIEPGQTWAQTVSASVPAPSFGVIKWRLVATSSGPAVTATSSTTHRPWLLLLLAIMLVVDLSLLGIRYFIQRRAAATGDPDGSAGGSAGGAAIDDDGVAVEDGVSHLAA